MLQPWLFKYSQALSFQEFTDLTCQNLKKCIHRNGNCEHLFAGNYEPISKIELITPEVAKQYILLLAYLTPLQSGRKETIFFGARRKQKHYIQLSGILPMLYSDNYVVVGEWAGYIRLTHTNPLTT